MDLPGVDLGALTDWLDRAAPGLRHGPLRGEVIAGGKSNLTYRISDGTNTWALRRPPLAHVLPTAHDMHREYTVIDALGGSAVPVPHAIALCEDADVLGAPFYLMGFVDGVVYDRPESLEGLTPEQAAITGEHLIDTLLALHAVVPADVGLERFGRPEGFLARQLTRWSAQWDASETTRRPQLAQVVDGLRDAMPEQSAAGIVHGDYRFTNCIYRPDGTIAAVVDWEMATLGDPLTDLGLMTVYHRLAEYENAIMPRLDPARGFLTADQLTQQYAAGSPRDLSALPWYVAFGYFKLAVVAEGIHHRYLQGKTVGAGFDHFGDDVPVLLERAVAELEGWRA